MSVANDILRMGYMYVTLETGEVVRLTAEEYIAAAFCNKCYVEMSGAKFVNGKGHPICLFCEGDAE